MMYLLHQKKLVLTFLFLFIVLGSYMMHSGMKITPWPKDQTVFSDTLSTVTISVLHTTKSPEVTIKPAKPINKPAKLLTKPARLITKPARLITKPARLITKPARLITKPAKSTEPDFFGDKYTTDDDLPQSSCPSSIRKKILKTDFAERFLANVPVLQWAKHFSEKEYERLRHYYGTYGWGGVDLKSLQSSLAILNTSANRLMFDDWDTRLNRSQCIRCAVIGNGGILKGSKKGREIDQSDYVFRTNGAVIKGFEEDVGSRTSFYTFSSNTLRNSLRSYAGLGFKSPPKSKETRYIFLPDHDKDYILMKAAAMPTQIETGSEQGVEPKSYFGNNVTVENFKMFHPDFIRYLRNRFLRSHTLDTKYKNIYRPSTGAVMLLAAVHTCDVVYAYGFMTPDYRKYSDHYYDKSFHPVQFYANHDLQMELGLWTQMHKAGLIKLYMRT